jgi:hypothetical protein
MVSPVVRFPRLHPFVALAVLLVGSGLSGRAETAPSDSPFLPAKPAPADSRSESSEPFQLSAIGVVEGKTYVSLYETADKRSHWIAVGGSLGKIQIVSCDVDAEQAVIRVDGKLKTLSLPKATVSAAATVALPNPTPSAPAAGAADQPGTPPASALSEEDQAREARMLVTDLLEIGMQQRKAYEDAQKKAAEQANKPPASN